MEKRPTIADVAHLARVSTATVSHVINATRYVSEPTRQAVLEAIRALNYRPSALAQGLASSRTRLVGVVLPDIHNPLFRHVYKRIEAELSQAGYDLTLADTGEDIRRQHSIVEALLSRQVDGLIVAPNYGLCDTPNPLHDARVPVVLIDRLSAECDFPTITVNNEEITYHAISHLIADGHQHIGFIGGLMDGGDGVSTVAQRLEGFCKALREHHLDVCDEHIHLRGKARQTDGYEAAKRLLRAESRPTALFTTNTLLLLGVLQALQELNLRCPEDIGVVSFDHDAWTDVYVPPITLVKQPTDEIGTAAAGLLLQLMNGDEPRDAASQVLPCELLVRGSCSPQCLRHYLAQQRRD